ncbi:NADH:ubiquinone oxidoreductase subunit 5 (chain L)/Multisubunit Na+/H+ antiporter, MnhA subunit [Olavius algarvensis Delta 1 endosymbiont]|nr:NADH:ubiquinone oxidoreductase subunit 5 (chain L)/Multisubunit Na+/H+ antiporter, MnhA subunit [Olavius algarvensis Delta 1 endosymbiont]
MGTVRDSKTYAIISAAMEVHKELGSGFLEPVYQEALEREFTYQEILYKPQHPVRIEYKGKPLKKTYEPDFIFYDDVVVEIKALEKLSGTEHAQVINYLKASKIGIGLLINFGSPSLQHKRFIYSK